MKQVVKGEYSIAKVKEREVDENSGASHTHTTHTSPHLINYYLLLPRKSILPLLHNYLTITSQQPSFKEVHCEEHAQKSNSSLIKNQRRRSECTKADSYFWLCADTWKYIYICLSYLPCLVQGHSSSRNKPEVEKTITQDHNTYIKPAHALKKFILHGRKLLLSKLKLLFPSNKKWRENQFFSQQP